MRVGYLILTSIFCLQTSCVEAALWGTLHLAKKEQKREFMTQLHQTNIEREKAGLPPLDVCNEKYYFDKGWAKEDPECKARIIRYENGDTKALGQQQMIIEEVKTEGNKNITNQE